jgi:hypothetical protein
LEHFLTAKRMPLCLKMLDGITAAIRDRREFPRDRGAIPNIRAKTSGARNFPRRVRDL